MMNPVDFDVFADGRCVETKLLGADASFYKTSRSRIHHCCFKMRHIYSWLSSVIYIYAHACVHGTGPSTWLCKFSWWYLPNTNWTHHRLVFKYTMSIGLTHRGPPVLAYASQQVVYNPFVPHVSQTIFRLIIYNRDIPPVDANGIFYTHTHIYIYTYI